MKRKSFMCIVTILIILLTSCSNVSDRLIYSEPDSVYKIAWQYVIQNTPQQITNAKITRLELVDTYRNPERQNVNVYALEYSYFIDRSLGWIPGGTDSGSPYLFVIEEDGMPHIMDIKNSREIINAGSFSEAAEINTNNQYFDFSKHSSDVLLFSQEEVDAAIEVVKQHFTSEENLLINLWYNNESYLDLIEQYKNNSLYGMDEAAIRGDLLILYSDVYFSEPDEKQLALGWKIILIRENENSLWTIIDQGY